MEMTDLKAAIDDYTNAAETSLMDVQSRLDALELGMHRPGSVGHKGYGYDEEHKSAFISGFMQKGDDATLAILARTAEAMMEAHLGVALIARDVAMYLDQFPARAAACGDWWQGMREGPMEWLTGASGAATLPVRPLISVSKIEIWQAGAWHEWAVENYSASTGLMPLLHRAQGSAWPVPGRAQEGIRVTARIGFGEDWNAVPANLRHAMLQLVAWLYTHRGDEAGEDAMRASGAAAMVTSYRKVQL